jgi:transposase
LAYRPYGASSSAWVPRSITKAGHVHVRRLLFEAAWNNRHNPEAALILKRRRKGQQPELLAIALEAQHLSLVRILSASKIANPNCNRYFVLVQ